MLGVVAAALVIASSPQVLPRFAFEPSKRLKQHRITMIGAPAAFDRWDGTIQFFIWKADWVSTKNRVRSELSRLYSDLEELPGNTAMLYFFGGADVRYSWGYGNTVALYRDFKAKGQRIKSLYEDSWNLKGSRAKGWITALVYIDDTFPRNASGRKFSVPHRW